MTDVGEKDSASHSGHNGFSDSAKLPTSLGVDIIIPVPETTVVETKLLRKIDFHVLPILFIVYVFSFLDRVNMSNALTLGLPEDLGLTGQQPNICLTIFFVPYILLEIPSNMVMRKLSPHIWLSGCILAFGVISIAQGFVQSYSGLLATRFFLGVAETGILPGSLYVISFWYKQQEAQTRFTAYWCSTIFAAAFGSLIASGIARMDGLHGLSGWRWVFILEGSATVVVAALAFFTISDFPNQAKWLTEDERIFVANKTKTKDSISHPITPRDFANFVAKPKHWVAALMFFSLAAPGYSLVYFIPTIVQGLGYNTVQTQLHSVPPFAAAFVLTVILAILSDRMRMRYPFIVFPLCLLIAGAAMCMNIHGVENFSAEYAGLCLAGMGSQGVGSQIVCWYVMNLDGHVERAIGSGWIVGFGNVGGIVATQAFQKRDAPLYRTGYSLALGLSIVSLVSCTGYALLIWRERKAAKAGNSDEDDVKHELYL